MCGVEGILAGGFVRREFGLEEGGWYGVGIVGGQTGYGILALEVMVSVYRILSLYAIIRLSQHDRTETL